MRQVVCILAAMTSVKIPVRTVRMTSALTLQCQANSGECNMLTYVQDCSVGSVSLSCLTLYVTWVQTARPFEAPKPGWRIS